MDTEPAFFETNPTAGVVGQPLSRVDGRDKVMGRAKYSAEYNNPVSYTHLTLPTKSLV